MKGNIYTDQRCPLCGGRMIHDEARDGCFCLNHPDIRASEGFHVRFGRDVFKRFNRSYEQAAQFLTGIRFKSVEGTFDTRDYRAENPLGFENQARKWLSIKNRQKLSKTTMLNLGKDIARAVKAWGNGNIKTIGEAEIEDFLFDDHRSERTGKPISDKTRANMRSTLHQFFTWACRREKLTMPVIPHVKFELGWRNIVDIDTQQAIIAEVRRLSWDINPKIWIGIKWLASEINVRPGEMRNVLEGDILLEHAIVRVTKTKEGSKRKGKYFLMDDEDVDLVKSFPRALPDVYFFRHCRGVSGIKAGEQFGPNYFKKWWDRACAELKIEGVGLYGGTKHSTTTALGELLSPEQIRRGGTEHATNAAFERYMLPNRREKIVVKGAIRKLQKRGQLVKIDPQKQKKVHHK